MINVDVEKYLALKEKKYYRKLGKVSKIVGLTIESIGPDARLNDLCRITSDKSGGQLSDLKITGYCLCRLNLWMESDQGHWWKIPVMS